MNKRRGLAYFYIRPKRRYSYRRYYKPQFKPFFRRRRNFIRNKRKYFNNNHQRYKRYKRPIRNINQRKKSEDITVKKKEEYEMTPYNSNSFLIDNYIKMNGPDFKNEEDEDEFQIGTMRENVSYNVLDFFASYEEAGLMESPIVHEPDNKEEQP